eukprot:1156378-Pelagomonas_calceolata.AAC.1
MRRSMSAKCLCPVALNSQQCLRSSQVTPPSRRQQSCHRHSKPKIKKSAKCLCPVALNSQQCLRSSQVTPPSRGQQSCHRHSRPNREKEQEQLLPAGHSVQPKMSHI